MEIDTKDQISIDWARSLLVNHKLSAVLARSGDQNAVYELKANDQSWFLKLGSNLEGEYQRLKWLKGKLPVPEVVGFRSEGKRDALLLTGIEGIDLAGLCKTWPAEKVVTKLAEALHQFHATDIANCPFSTSSKGKLLVHGDACLPNFIFKDDKLSGYIDLGDLRVDDANVDLSAAVWSLQYNLGPGLGLSFLKQYGVTNADEMLVEKLRLQYEQDA